MPKQDGYTWKCEMTDLSGQPYTCYIVSESSTITPDTPLSITSIFSSATADCPTIRSRRVGKSSLCGITIAATEAVDFVNYNKKSGNKVVIDFTRPEGEEVVSWTDDFVPNSEGAVYEIYGTDGQTHTLVVGETPEGWIGPFAGAWYYNEYGEILQPAGLGSCEVVGFDGAYYIECHQK